MAYTHITTVVTRRTIEADGIVALDLQDPDRWPLPGFTAGSHIDVVLPGGLLRQYSLCGDPADRLRYRVGVLDVKGGRGGSAAVHQFQVGDIVSVSLPRNHFPIADVATKHVLIGGGIGITPLLSMVSELRRRGADFFLQICARSAKVTPFKDELDAIVREGRAAIHYDGGDPTAGLDLQELLRNPSKGDHVYCCGPGGFMDAVAAATSHWPEETVHFERFGAPPAAANRTGTAYTIELARSKRELIVAPGQTMSDAIKAADIALDTSCQAGTCGACKTRYLSGSPIHRDMVLRRAERGAYVTPCVSGCASDRMVLDL